MSADLDEHDYLRRVELLARDVVDRAADEGWLSYRSDSSDAATPLQRVVNELARTLLHYHFEGDGCMEESRLYRIGAAGIIRPDAGHGSYDELCGSLGVEARPEGWALWHAWDDEQEPHTLVTTCITTTEGLLSNWARGISVLPALPDRAQVIAVVRGWVGPATLSPDHAAQRGLSGG
ncbi:hypothetical protein ACIBHX_20675 [Nonomuraea sp. NPDC050536]|uniref:hypothetical protein n=1 Tax=Nonomuraea sp. NPDC050536 TaxID=3364366 RepID=UPI0037CB1B50